MRNCTKNYFKQAKKWMFLVGFIFLSLGVKAQIPTINTIVEPPVYVTGGSNELTFHVWFGVFSPEFADFIEFIAPPGVTLHSNFHLSEEYYECGKNHGELMPANFGANGIGWGRPGWSTGGSQCGAFQDSTWHSFKVRIEADASVTGSILITCNVYGDGFNLPTPSFASATIGIVNTDCTLICPDNVTVNSDPGECGAYVDFRALGSGGCNFTEIDESRDYPVGTTQVDFIANAGTLDEVRCTRFVTVVDSESPYFTDCVNRSVNLGAGECSGTVDFDIGIEENCGNLPHSLVQTKLNDLDFNVACNLGPTHYYRVYNLQDYDILNDFMVNTVEIGVYESFNLPIVDVNIYALDGAFELANLTLLNTTSVSLPDLDQSMYTVNLPTLIEGGSTIVVEVVTPINNGTFGSIMGFNNVEELETTFIRSPSCNELDPVPMDQAFNGTVSGSVVLNVHGEEEAIKISPNHGSGLMPGDDFDMGLHQLSYTVSDAAGNTSVCAFDLEVLGNGGGSGVLACNDTVRISMEEFCTMLITPDMVLEGDHYGCYEIYDVIVYDPDGNPIGDLVTAEYVGMILDVDVYFEDLNNRCSSKLVIEDYYPPVFNCDTVTTTCVGDLLPGSPIPDILAYNIEPVNDSIPDDQIFSTNIVIPVNGLTDAIVTDLDVLFDISHSAVYDLSATLTAPDGTIISLFNKPGGNVSCTNDDLSLRFDDDAVNGPTELDQLCEAESPAVSGTFRPVTALSTLNGMVINGNWTITITDDSPIDGGTINLITLAFHQAGGVLSLPIPPGTNFSFEGANEFIAYDFDACGPTQLTYEDEVVTMDCDSPFSSLIYRHWIAIDPSGNTSTCTQLVQVLNNRISFLSFPPHYDDIEEESFTCLPGDDFYPGPDLTGYPFGDLCEDIQMTYEDQRIDICPGTFKILRNWRVVDWCSGTVIQHVQVIKVLDEEGPIVTTGVPDVTLFTESLACETDVDLPDPFGEPSMIIYDCREEEITYEVFYKLADPDGSAPSSMTPWIQDERIVFVDDGNGKYHYRMIDLPQDSTWIKYVFTDPCGNSTESFFEIIVVDTAPPIAVCDEHTQVTLGADGTALVEAITFDDGSHDNCSDIVFDVRRMDPVCDDVTEFRDSILFCCEDVGTIQMVELRVTDENGNSSSCMVEVQVDDKFPPLLICPDDITLDCQTDFTDTSITGFAEAYDNCGIDTVYYRDNENIDICGNGNVLRTWYAEDVNGFSSSCYQIITLEDDEPFSEKDIHWPADITLEECESNTFPEITGIVQTDDDFCSLVAITYKDQVFNIVEDACIKILRKWSVVDWCTFDDDKPYSSGYWEHTQVIKLVNTDAPEFEDDCVALDFCSYGHCEGQIEFIKVAHDDCTPDELLRWEHHIDLYNDGVFDEYGIKSNDASGTYPDGIHRIAWRVEDGCGNVNTCEQLFEVRDCKKPTPLCISQLTTVVMNNNGMVTICAEDFDVCGHCESGSYDNCTAQEDLIFSFSADISDTCRTLTCEDIPNGESIIIELQMWVTDEAGNQEFCDVSLDLQDNEGDACQDTLAGAIVVSGMIRNPEEQPVPGVEIMLENEMSNIGFPRFEFTDETGAYAFNNLYGNNDYQVTPYSDEEPGAGVSTLDLIFIQRHILGLESLNPPYQLIAADADNNEKITAGDLLAIRKLILGVNDSFINGQKSWRFISVWNDFLDPNHPFPFLESINTEDYKELLEQVHFTGVKIGDINNSALMHRNGEVESRSNETFVLTTDQQKFEAGSVIQVPFYGKDLDQILGSQFTIEFNSDVLKLENIEPLAPYLNDQHFGQRYIEQGLITTSWNLAEPASIEDQRLFNLTFSAISDGKLNDVIRLTDRITPAEAYDPAFSVMSVDLRFGSGSDAASAKDYTLHQNIPNPFSDATEIYFELPEDANARISFFDLTGNLIKQLDGEYQKGMNKVEIDKRTLGTTGVIYYTLETGAFTQTRKMICIN